MRALKPPFPGLWHGLECHWVCRGPPRPTCAIPGHTHVHPARKCRRNAAKPCKVGHARESCQRMSVSLRWMPPLNIFPRLWHIQSLGNIFSQPTAHRDRLAIACSVSLAHDCARLSFAVRADLGTVRRMSVSLRWMPPLNIFPRLWHIQSLGNIFSQPTAHRDRLAIARSVSLAHDCARLSFAVLELR